MLFFSKKIWWNKIFLSTEHLSDASHKINCEKKLSSSGVMGRWLRSGWTVAGSNPGRGRFSKQGVIS